MKITYYWKGNKCSLWLLNLCAYDMEKAFITVHMPCWCLGLKTFFSHDRIKLSIQLKGR